MATSEPVRKRRDFAAYILAGWGFLLLLFSFLAKSKPNSTALRFKSSMALGDLLFIAPIIDSFETILVKETMAPRAIIFATTGVPRFSLAVLVNGKLSPLWQEADPPGQSLSSVFHHPLS